MVWEDGASVLASLLASKRRWNGRATYGQPMATRRNQTRLKIVETPVVRNTTQAREGVTGHGVRYVLLISTAAVVVLFAAIWFYYFH
jgi:hypothetical protein